MTVKYRQTKEKRKLKVPQITPSQVSITLLTWGFSFHILLCVHACKTHSLSGHSAQDEGLEAPRQRS